MKVLVGYFATEVNEHIPCMTELKDYDLVFGQEILSRMQLTDLFAREGVEAIPSVYAKSSPNGIIKKEAFLAIENHLLRTLREHLAELDGIYLHLHGASYVEGIGSGDHHLLAQIRNITGPYLPIAVTCDPHGNLTQDYVSSLQILRSYRQSPHTDMIETWQWAVKKLCGLLKARQNIHCVYRRLPLILGGEQSVSADEPVRSINEKMDELEKDPRILSASWHVGYLRHDCPEAGCGIVVVPSSQADQNYAEQTADELADFVWQRRHEFHYTGITAPPEQALRMALEAEGKPFVITDSGDNTTSGATGWNTGILRQFLEVRDLKKSVLFASIVDPETVRQLLALTEGTVTRIHLGKDEDELSRAVDLEVRLKSKGKVVRTVSFAPGQDELAACAGSCVVAEVIGKPVEIIIADHKLSYFKTVQYEQAGIQDWTQFDILVVKQGYIFPELKASASGYVMAMTDGATPQDTKHIAFKRILRPMVPIDEI